jgi:hypothetical protein
LTRAPTSRRVHTPYPSSSHPKRYSLPPLHSQRCTYARTRVRAYVSVESTRIGSSESLRDPVTPLALGARRRYPDAGAITFTFTFTSGLQRAQSSPASKKKRADRSCSQRSPWAETGPLPMSPFGNET